MKKLLSVVLIVFAIATTVQNAAAQTATQDVTITVAAVDIISVSSGALTITIDNGTPGGALGPKTDNSTTYAITSNNPATTKITGSLGVAYSVGLSLDVTLTAPTSSGSSVGAVTLTTTDQNLVTGMSAQNEAGLGILYSASAAANFAPGSETRTMTLTITA